MQHFPEMIHTSEACADGNNPSLGAGLIKIFCLFMDDVLLLFLLSNESQCLWVIHTSNRHIKYT